MACNVDSTYGGETVRGRFLGFPRNGGKGETYQTSGGECFAVRYGLSDSCLRLAAYGPLPARHPPPEWGWAGKKGALLFFQV